MTKRKDIQNERLAEIAIDIEQNHIKEVVGSQDQISASYGGFNQIIFSKILVEYAIVGSYEDYMSFRKQLALKKAILYIESEEIKVNPDGIQNKIKVKLTLSTYRMGEFDYEKI